jgi:hypothetical protein
MSRKCRAFSASKLGLEPADNRKAFYAGWDAALAQPQPEQEQAEPVLVVEKEPDYMSRGHFYEGSKPFIDPTLVWKLPIGTKLYTHPPRREWQSLTDTDIARVFRAVYGGTRFGPSEKEFAIAIEAKLKEKNDG